VCDQVFCVAIKGYLPAEQSWQISPDCSGKPTAKRSEARTWSGKRDHSYCVL